MMYGSDAAYGSMKRLGSSSKPSCTTGFSGAQVVKITSSIAKPLGLNEIEIIDENGVNVALKAKCYSSSSNSTAILNSGDPKCLNDGDIGSLPESCISVSDMRLNYQNPAAPSFVIVISNRVVTSNLLSLRKETSTFAYSQSQ